MSVSTRRMVESAILIAIGTVLSILSFPGPWALGGSITICSMLPLVMISWRHGMKWGLFSAFIYSLIQLTLGFKNIGYGRNAGEMLLIALLDYIIAFCAISLSSLWKGKHADQRIDLLLGIVFTLMLRFMSHFISGWLIWEALWPNGRGLAAPAWSFIYNGSYMLPEILITGIVAWLSYTPLKRYWLGEDLVKR